VIHLVWIGLDLIIFILIFFSRPALQLLVTLLSLDSFFLFLSGSFVVVVHLYNVHIRDSLTGEYF